MRVSDSRVLGPSRQILAAGSTFFQTSARPIFFVSGSSSKTTTMSPTKTRGSSLLMMSK